MKEKIRDFLKLNELDLYDIIDKNYKHLINSWERPESRKEDIKDLIFKDFLNYPLEELELEHSEEEMSEIINDLEEEIFELLELDYF